MMREGWTYKKLGEVATLYDSQRKPVTKKDRVAGIYPYYGASGIQDYVDNYIFNGRFLLLGEDGAKWGANEKSAFIIEGKAWVNNHAHIMTFDESVIDRFVEYYLNGKDLNGYITGAIVPKLTQARLQVIPIPIPPISEQERIVAELDLLTSLIEKEKEQLKDYDTLAQSIFFDMFGDPIENSKGWEVKKLGEVCREVGDGLHGTPRYDPNGKIAFINGNNLINGKITITEKTLFVNDKEAKKIHIELDTNTVLLSINGTLGKTAIYNNENVVLGKSACYCKLTNQLNVKFVISLMNTNAFKDFLENNSSKSTIKNVGLKTIREFSIILPPLSLQESFAKQVEAIEEQKRRITETIANTQRLFDYTMDKYFG